MIRPASTAGIRPGGANSCFTLANPMTIMLWLAIGGGAVAAVCGVILAIFALRFAGLAWRALV